ncbi:MAG: HAD hydrolase-like protein [bacterium]|nr:HAD hydrolase-like protein [bacterium]
MRSDLGIFDIDGVLVDVRDSYRKAIVHTALCYLKKYIKLDLGGKFIIDDGVVSAFKDCGGFNNDWDLTAAIIGYAVSSNRDDIKSGLDDFLKSVGNYGGGISAVEKVLGGLPKEVKYSGDVRSGNVVKRIFQEYYFGAEKFRRRFEMEPEFNKEEGFFAREKLLLTAAMLDQLQKIITLSIATGRDGYECNMVMERFSIGRYFPVIVNDDDIKKDEKRLGKRELSKPNPYIIEKNISRNNCFGKIYYFGDTADDMVAAVGCKKYEIIPVGCVYALNQPERAEERLIAAGARYVAHSPEQIFELLDA